MIKNYQTPIQEPGANICIQKNRLKLYNEKFVYLNDKQEFTLEIYNPTQSTILAKIKLNDKYISSSGLVLRPGERIYLDRFLDDAKKFMFDTYEVSNNPTNQKAIEKNGLVSVEFYNEYTPTYTYYGVTTTWVTNPGTFTIQTGSPLINLPGTIGNGNITFGTSSSGNLTYTNTTASGTLSSVNNSKSIETGRVEKGSNSNQKFDGVNMSFTSWMFKSVEYQILPKSQKPVESQELRKYCTSCGTKAKKEHKFCSACGTKL